MRHIKFDINQIEATRRLDLTVTFNGKESKVRPHGLIGQSYDESMIPRFGKTDEYPMRHANATFVTQAMAEGAIDGIPDDYSKGWRVHALYF